MVSVAFIVIVSLEPEIEAAPVAANVIAPAAPIGSVEVKLITVVSPLAMPYVVFSSVV